MNKCLQALRWPLLCLPALAGSVHAAEFGFNEFHGEYTLTGSYAAAFRIEDPDHRIIDAPGRPEVPVAEDLKYPESNNFDDGDRNFDKYDLVNNRLTFIGDIQLDWRDYGLLLRGDAFYDDVYADNNRNAHDAPDRISTTQEPFNTFTDAADRFSGQRSRLLDAYVYGNFYFGDNVTLNLRLGRHIAAWGQSLFFNGVALSQATADATRATIPGVDVKSILLPINQLSARLALTDRIVLLGQYHFEFKPFELNPVGEFFSPADIVGPGREFIYGFKNPFSPDNLAAFDITDPDDIADVVLTINQFFDGQLNTGALEDFLRGLPLDFIPSLSLPQTGQNPYNAPDGLNPTYAGDLEPDRDDNQFGLGMLYRLTDVTELGAYYLRYHQKTPAVQVNFGELVLIPEQEIAPGVAIPGLTTADLGLNVPETYNIRYFDNVDLYAVGISTLVFGWNVGGEIIRREGVDVLVDVDEGINGPIPTPTRANTNQVILNAIYTFRPKFFESIIFVGEIGWIQAEDVQGQPSHEGANEGQHFDELTFDEEAWGLAMLAFLEKRNIFAGWDLRIPLSYQRALKGRAPLAGAFGSLFDEDDVRIGIGFEFTRLNKLTLGINYSGFTGGAPHFFDRPLQDRDTIGLNVKYSFF